VAAVLVACSLLYGVTVAMLLHHPGPRDPDQPAEIIARAEAPRPAGGRQSGPQPLPAVIAPRPVGLSIPAIDVEESVLLPLGLTADGSMQVPEDYARVGWFTGASVPGTAGPAVIAGHVDSRSGPAVFFRLRELRAGDAVTVLLADGSRVRYLVDGVEQYPKDDFPTRTVFGPVPGEALRLITCGGSFDRVARSYRDNIVVYATRRDVAK
jgi:LPXTG-site transpeptidase (sortase) family protein